MHGLDCHQGSGALSGVRWAIFAKWKGEAYAYTRRWDFSIERGVLTSCMIQSFMGGTVEKAMAYSLERWAWQTDDEMTMMRCIYDA